MGVFGFLKEHEAHGSESKKPMAELIANAGPSDDRASTCRSRSAASSNPRPARPFERRRAHLTIELD
jgi:hypothetical protein